MSEEKKVVGRRGTGRGTRRLPPPTSPPGLSEEETPAAASGVAAAAEEASGRGRGGGRAKVPQAEAPSAPPPSSKKDVSKEEDVSPDREMAKLELEEFAARPPSGTVGRPIKLETNHFAITYGEQRMEVTQYHVDIVHPRFKMSREDNRLAFWKIVTDHPQIFGDRYKIAYDGAHIFYALKKLTFPNGSTSMFSVGSEVRTARDQILANVEARVSIVGLVDVDMRAVRVSSMANGQNVTPLQCLDVICRQNRSLFGSVLDREDWYVFGSTTYVIPGPTMQAQRDPIALGGGCFMWLGMYTGTRVSQVYRPLLNIDVSHGTFYYKDRVNAVDFLVDVLNETERGARYDKRQLTPTTKLSLGQQKNFEKAIKGVRVKILHRPNQVRVERVHAIPMPGPACDVMFRVEGEEPQSIASYFAKRYGTLQYPGLPVVHIGSRKKNVYVPIEHCYLAHPQRCNKKLTDNQLSTMIKTAAVPAPQRRNKISQLVDDAKFDMDPWLKAFGVKISKDMTKLGGRVLPAPKVAYNPVGCNSRDGPVVTPREGVWRLDGQKVAVAGGPLKTYGIMLPRRTSENDVALFFQRLSQEAGVMGVQLASSSNVEIGWYTDVTEIERAMTELITRLEANKSAIPFIFVALKEKSTLFYSEVKRVAEIITGAMTQCLQMKTIFAVARDQAGKSRQTLQNLTLKINAKLGGINNRLHSEGLWKELTDAASPTLIVGVDISHPGPLDKRSPSVAAVIGNVDLGATRYSASIKIQPWRQEQVVHLLDPIRERLLAFHKQTKMKPARIIFYRDGVADSQFKEIVQRELKNIREACAALSPDYRPKITFIVTMKRHHTRFFCLDAKDQVGRSGNIPPGTVVDQAITSPELFDFYVCAHMGIQGTSRPTRYTVLCDENKFTTDQIQLLTYSLSHVYCRCARSVSIPTPVYYAHLASLRAKYHLGNVIADFGSDVLSEVGRAESATVTESDLTKGATVVETVRGTMYFV